MKPKLAAAVALIALIAVPLAIFFGGTGASPEGDEFSAYSSDGDPDDAAEVVNGFDVVHKPVEKSTPGGKAPGKTKVRKEMVRQEDTLNRPGPDGFAADGTPSGRVKKNVRPADGEDPGKQAVGSLDKEDVRAGIDAVRPLAKECYESMLKEFPDAEGKVTVSFSIIGENGKGRVEMSELAEDGTTLFDEKMNDCLLKSVGEAEFETPSGGGTVSVRYPFKFATEADE